MSVNKSLQAVLAPQVTEKATMVADKHNQIAFKVKKDATKKEVKEAIELMLPACVCLKRPGRIPGRGPSARVRSHL